MSDERILGAEIQSVSGGVAFVTREKAFPFDITIGGENTCATVTLNADGTYKGNAQELQESLEDASRPSSGVDGLALVVGWTILRAMKDDQ